MSNEIQYRHDDTGETLYAVVVDNDPESSDYQKYWNGSAFEALTVGNWGDYDIALTESPASGYHYQGTFPAAISAGWYDVLILVQDGGSPAISDRLLAQRTAYWDGSGLSPDALGVDVDSTGGAAVTARKALEALLACCVGNSTFAESTGVASFKGRDGSTEVATYTVTDVGTRSSSGVS